MGVTTWSIDGRASWLSACLWFSYICIASAALLPSEASSQINQMKKWLWICEHMLIFFLYVCINGSVLLWEKVVLEREITFTACEFCVEGKMYLVLPGLFAKQNLFLFKFKCRKQSLLTTKNFPCTPPTSLPGLQICGQLFWLRT